MRFEWARYRWLMAAGLSMVLLALPLLLLALWQAEDDGYGLQLGPQEPLNFHWHDVAGQTHTLDAWAGQPVLLFFGFLSCADYCPMRLEQLRQVGGELSRARPGGNVRILFITVDPDHDSAAALQAIVDDYPGLQSGYMNAEELEAVATRLREKLQKTPAGWRHAANLYLLIPERGVQRVYSQTDLVISRVVEDIRRLAD